MLIASFTPCYAPEMDSKILEARGLTLSLRPNFEYFTRLFSSIGLPACSVLVVDSDALAVGIQVFAAL